MSEENIERENLKKQLTEFYKPGGGYIKQLNINIIRVLKEEEKKNREGKIEK